jgi:DNA invertase Pin-like site-specific DNA recombinase
MSNNKKAQEKAALIEKIRELSPTLSIAEIAAECKVSYMTVLNIQNDPANGITNVVRKWKANTLKRDRSPVPDGIFDYNNMKRLI